MYCYDFFLGLDSISLTRFSVYIFGFEVTGLEGDQRQCRVGRVVAERNEQFATFVFDGWFKGLPKGRFLAKVDLFFFYKLKIIDLTSNNWLLHFRLLLDKGVQRLRRLNRRVRIGRSRRRAGEARDSVASG